MPVKEEIDYFSYPLLWQEFYNNVPDRASTFKGLLFPSLF
jgi:hypothetical protein